MISIVQLFQREHVDKAQFSQLIRPHIEIMYRMAWKWTGSQDDAEDLVQDVLVNLAGRVKQMRKIEDLRPWLVKITYHRYVDLYRRNKTSPVININDVPQDEDTALTHYDDILKIQETETIERAMEALSHDQRDTLILHDIQGYTEEETAEKLNISTGTVKSRLHRARKKLKESVDDGTFSEPQSC